MINPLCSRLSGPVQTRPECEAPQGADGVHQAPDPGAGERVLSTQLPDQTKTLRAGCRSRPHGETGERTGRGGRSGWRSGWIWGDKGRVEGRGERVREMGRGKRAREKGRGERAREKSEDKGE